MRPWKRTSTTERRITWPGNDQDLRSPRLKVRAGYLGRSVGGTPDLWFVNGPGVWEEFQTQAAAFAWAEKRARR